MKMCDVLQVSKSGYYKWRHNRDNPDPDQADYEKVIRQKIKKSFHDSDGTYGSPRVHDDLVEDGYVISEKTVGRKMKEMGLRATPKEKYIATTDSNHDLKTYPNIVDQSFTAEEPNQLWMADITYVWTLEGWVYVSSIMDAYSRKIVGWNLDITMKKELTMRALDMALFSRQPTDELIHHSDRGSQYCSNAYIDTLKHQDIQISMSRRGNPYDNACIESFHATLKKELIHRRRFPTRAEAIKAINYYISHRYNERRKHSAIGYCSPNQFERQHQFQSLEQSS